MKHTVCIVTATRAEYGLLKPLLGKLKEKDNIEIRLVVTGTHLSEIYGSTWKEIEADGFEIDRKLAILPESGMPQGISDCMAQTLIGFAAYFAECRPELLLVLGDRYEILSVCIAAVNEGIPIGHIHGGETTEGAVDECFRHSITKMSALHFTAAEPYRRRVIQLGENPETVFMTGAMGVENILNLRKMSLAELEQDLGMELKQKFALVTFHPATLEYGEAEKQCLALTEALVAENHLFYIITMANADAGGNLVNRCMREFADRYKNAVLVPSLGTIRYLSLMKESTMVIGNSSSGIIEAPVFHVPTVDIGSRQKGRLKADSVISCGTGKEEILRAIRQAQTEEWKERCGQAKSLYGSGDTSGRIADIVEEYLLGGRRKLQKKFYDIGW